MVNYIALITAIAVSIVAAYYSVVGLVSIFAAAMVPVAIMAATLEVGKLVTVSWLYHNWEHTPKILKAYLISAIFVLMFITSLGIFGFLSKAHIDQTLSTSNNDIEISIIDNQIENKQLSISNKEKVIQQLDDIVQTLIDAKRIRGREGSVSIRKQQEPDRKALTDGIENDRIAIQELRVRKSILEKEQVGLEAEIGPLAYVSEMIYGEKRVEESVQLIILVIIFAFDPLAVLLLLAANIGLAKKNRNAATVLKKMAQQLKGNKK